jgi:hypothetical protein
MRVTIDWQKPIPLTKHRKIIIQEKELLRLVDERAGLYFFSRKFGDVFRPFYIGESTNVRKRLRSHWKSAKIRFVLRGIVDDDMAAIKGGERFFHFGYLSVNVDEPKRYLKIGQKYLIRFAIQDGCTLLNKSLTKIRSHTLEFNGEKNGRAIYPKTAEIEAESTPRVVKSRARLPP